MADHDAQVIKEQTQAAEFDVELAAFIERKITEGATVLQAEEVFGEVLTAGAYLTPGAWPDAAGNIFQWVAFNNPHVFSTQSVSYVRYVSPDEQQLLGEALVINADGRKTDGVTAIQIADKLVIYPSGHELKEGPRRNALDRAVWDIGAVPYAAGQKPKTGAGVGAAQQMFTDVPPGSAFYDYVQYLASTGAVGGYPCGGPNEPCDAQNRPYFRPQNTPTRGQLCKIIALAVGFTPE